MQKPSSTPETTRSWQVTEQSVRTSHRWRSPVVIGALAVIGALSGIVLWSVTAPLESAVVASGKVSVSTKRKEIQHLDGGIIKSIRVRDGDVVHNGDVLFELDETKSKARYLLSRAALLSTTAQYARLVAERDGADSVTFPATLIWQARRRPEIAKAVATQRSLFERRREELAGQIKISLHKIAQLKDQIAGLTSQRVAAAAQSDLAAKEDAVVEAMFERGYVTRQRVHSIRREVAQLTGEAGRLDAELAKARKEIEETELSLRQFTIKRQSDTLAELKDAEQRIFDLKETYVAAAAELARLTVTAPVDGFVVNSQLHTIGGVVRAGQTVLEIVPAGDALIVEARVRPLDIDGIAKGQDTEVRFSAFKQRTTPPLEGSIINVSADVESDQRTGELYYTATVSVPNAELAKLGRPLLPGMPAELFIKTGKRTLVAYLSQPLVDSMSRAMREK